MSAVVLAPPVSFAVPGVDAVRCEACGTPVVVAELHRRIRAGNRTRLTDGETISFCPVHGLNFVPKYTFVPRRAASDPSLPRVEIVENPIRIPPVVPRPRRYESTRGQPEVLIHKNRRLRTCRDCGLVTIKTASGWETHKRSHRAWLSRAAR